MSAEVKQMRARAIAGALLHRVDTSQLGHDDGVAVGACRTDRKPAAKSEFQAGVTPLEVVWWFVAGGLTAIVISPDLGVLIWNFLKLCPYSDSPASTCAAAFR